MIIVDNALKAREAQGKPIRVGMIGAGFMGAGPGQPDRSLACPASGMVAIYNRQRRAGHQGVPVRAALEPVVANTQDAFEDAIRAGKPVVTEDAMLLAARSRSTAWSTSPAPSSSACASSSRRSSTASTSC